MNLQVKTNLEQKLVLFQKASSGNRAFLSKEEESVQGPCLQIKCGVSLIAMPVLSFAYLSLVKGHLERKTRHTCWKIIFDLSSSDLNYSS